MLKYFSNAVSQCSQEKPCWVKIRDFYISLQLLHSTAFTHAGKAQIFGPNILGHHTSAAPWLLCGHISLTSSLSPRLKKPPDQQPPPVSSQRPREMLQSQTEPCTSVAFPTCSVHCVSQDTSSTVTRDRRCSFLLQLHGTRFPFLLQHSYFCL